MYVHQNNKYCGYHAPAGDLISSFSPKLQQSHIEDLLNMFDIRISSTANNYASHELEQRYNDAKEAERTNYHLKRDPMAYNFIDKTLEFQQNSYPLELWTAQQHHKSKFTEMASFVLADFAADCQRKVAYKPGDERTILNELLVPISKTMETL